MQGCSELEEGFEVHYSTLIGTLSTKNMHAFVDRFIWPSGFSLVRPRLDGGRGSGLCEEALGF